jgi:pyruvate/2-oxoglutarate dehydrogenase complex dihydrolipoamide dehydrogenase (E3) component
VVSTGSVTERYENLVVGGGMAGLPIALRAARHGRTAFVEKEKLGGTCLNRGCIPTKTMIASAAVAHHVRRAAEFGAHTGQPRVDLSEVVDRKDKIVAGIRGGSYRAVSKADGMDFFEAEGQFVGPRRLRAGGADGPVIEADRIFLVTGTRTATPDIEGIDRVPYFTSRTLWISGHCPNTSS